MSAFRIVFTDDKDLMDFAKQFIDERLSSLDNDVKRCLPTNVDRKEAPCYAPFPALLYCFSVIDLLGALYAGHARTSITVANSKKYMIDLMNYKEDQIDILQKKCLVIKWFI